ncbi:MAG: sugar ABC transporter ATP-binding protein [Candidatus Excrementavichristensenella sp.]|jgi:ribose transport system ATP-binding protein
MASYNGTPIMEMRGIVKEFPGVLALSNLSFDVYKGECHCLVGENGAGKSTLMKILSGAYTPTSGTITLDGKDYKQLTPMQSKNLGIEIVYQENDLVPTMNAIENVFVGKEITKFGGFVDFEAEREKVYALMERYGIEIDPLQTIENMSVSDQQFVKILKALMNESRILIMDEPTSMFNVEDAGKVLRLVENITAAGISVVYISHFLKEVIQIADRITVIRDGSVINTYDNAGRDMDLTVITRDMVGRPVEVFYQKDKCEIGDIMFEVKDLKLTRDSPSVSFGVRRGEILGLSGMVGSGRTELVRAISGADPRHSGDMYLNGKKLTIRSPRDGIDAGIAHITEDRQRLGLNLGASLLENTLIVGLQQKDKIPDGPLYNCNAYADQVEKIVDKLHIKTPSLQQVVLNLSGGNQQKVVLGKWLFAERSVYIFDEPTRGIDVNAKAEFYKEMTALTRAGNCIIMVSSDLPEMISMSDRVLVVRDGGIHCELASEDINEQTIIKEALGVG